MSKFKVSKKYPGVFSYPMANGDVSFYIGYNDKNKKYKKEKIGKKSEGITEKYCHQKRVETIHKIRLGEDPFEDWKRKEVIPFSSFAEVYFNFLENKEPRKDKDPEKNLKAKLKYGKIPESYNARSRYRIHIEKFIGNKDVYEVTSDDINKIKEAMREKGRAETTINHCISLISTIYNHMVKREEYDGKNPVKSFNVTFEKVDGVRDKFLSKKQVDQLLEAIQDMNVERVGEKNTAKAVAKRELINRFVRFALSTGARASAVMSIQRKHIDVETRTVFLNDYKSRSSYFGYLNKNLLPDLSFLDEMEPDDYVVGYNGEQVWTSTIQKPLQTILDTLFNQKIDKKDRKNRVVIHTLRHTFASLLAESGTPMYNVQQFMNHKDPKMTARYAKLSPHSGREFVDSLCSPPQYLDQV